MSSRRLIPVVALLLLAAAVLVVGADRMDGVRVPPGALVDSPNARVGSDVPAPAIPVAPALPAPVADVLFYDDFSTNTSRWQSLSSAPGTWLAQEGRLQQRGDIAGELTDEPAALVIKDLKPGDLSIEAQVYPTRGTPVGVVFRASDAGYYRVRLFAGPPNNSLTALLEKINGDSVETVERIASTSGETWPGFTRDQWHLVRTSAVGDHITVSVDGLLILEARDSAHRDGQAGVWTFTDMGAQFDNVRIQRATNR